MPETYSKLAAALSESVVGILPGAVQTPALTGMVSRAIDERLAEVRKAYESEELVRCPIVTHHGDSPCPFCITSAMREFILLPEQL